MEDQQVIRRESAALHAKITKVAIACRHIERDGNNSDQRYRYISADAVAEHVLGAAFDSGLSIVDNVEPITPPGETYAVKSGALWRFCRIKMTMTIVDSETGAREDFVGYGDGTDPADKAILKAQTAARRDLLKRIFGVTSKEDTAQDPEADAQTDREHPQQGRNAGHYTNRGDERQQRPAQQQREPRPDRGASTPSERDYGDARPQQRSEQRPAPQQRQEPEQFTGGRAIVFRFGPCPQVPIGAMGDADLAKYRRVMAVELADPAKAKWRDKAEERLRALDGEIERRRSRAA
jgi:hypothetical protein